MHRLPAGGTLPIKIPVWLSRQEKASIRRQACLLEDCRHMGVSDSLKEISFYEVVNEIDLKLEL